MVFGQGVTLVLHERRQAARVVPSAPAVSRPAPAVSRPAPAQARFGGGWLQVGEVGEDRVSDVIQVLEA